MLTTFAVIGALVVGLVAGFYAGQIKETAEDAARFKRESLPDRHAPR